MKMDFDNGRLIATTPAEQEHIERLAYQAFLAAIEAPLKRGESVRTCGIRWNLIEKLRSIAGAAGLDWRRSAKSYRTRTRIASLESEIERNENWKASTEKGEADRLARLERHRAELAKLRDKLAQI